MLLSTDPQKFGSDKATPSRVRRRVAIAGQVLDALTQQPIPGATVKLDLHPLDSPTPPDLPALQKFAQQVLPKIKWMVSLKPSIHVPSPPAASAAPNSLEALTKLLKDGNVPDLVGTFRSFFTVPTISSEDKWTGLEQIFYNAKIIQRHNLKALDQLTIVQTILDLDIVPFEFSQLSPERTQTAADGWFHFLTLPEGGPYGLIASWPSAGTRYSATSLPTADLRKIVQPKDPQIDRVQVPVAAQGFGAARLYLVPTTIWGRVTEDNAGVKLAKVQIAGQPEFTLTFSTDNPSISCKLYDQNQQLVTPNQIGYYLILALEAFSVDSTQISVVSPGPFSNASIQSVDLKKFSLNPGEVKMINFQLTAKLKSS